MFFAFIFDFLLNQAGEAASGGQSFWPAVVSAISVKQTDRETGNSAAPTVPADSRTGSSGKARRQPLQCRLKYAAMRPHEVASARSVPGEHGFRNAV
ncbi:hypothetical protein LFL96_04160 [Paraburkholderia sp. D15]|uniref:hypothetical protein n=1 Tax=Paraburkholderia sp. D15 TaxID=2880218 RepID=UPI0024789073|nr:hypothetical protein [Paraburkholderia sp. D15]WGS50711.1 hypothetical protein LFL96_04160 [Paraburkholderia sp. D15]